MAETQQTATTAKNPYAPNPYRSKFKATIAEMRRKNEDPNFIRYVMDQEGYDVSLVDQELANLQSYDSGEPIQAAKPNPNAVPGDKLDQTQLTTAQSTALLYGQRAYQSAKILDTLDEGVADKGFLGSVKQKIDEANVGGTVTNQFVGEDFKKYDQAKRDFVNATLRRESGAVISDQEFENANRQYFPRPGDSKEILDQKKANRELVAKGFLKSAGVTDAEIAFDGQQQPVQGGGEVEQAKAWLEANPSDPRAEKVKAKIAQLEGSNLGASVAPESSAAVEKPVSSAIGKIGEFLGIKKFGEGIGTAIFLKTTEGKELQKKAAEGDKIALETLQAILDEAPSNKELVGSASLTALNAASGGLLKGAVGATTASGKIAAGAASGYAYDVAGDLEQNKTITEAATPGLGTATGGVLATAGVIANWAGKKGSKVAERVYNSAVKPSIEDTKKAILYNGKTLGRKLLDEGIAGGDEKLLVKATAGLKTNEAKLQKILANSDATITRDELIPYLTKLREKLANTPTARAQKAAGTIDESLQLLPDSFSLSKANELKRSLYQELGDLAYKLDPSLSGSAETSKAIASGLKDLIEKKSADPSVPVLNRNLSTFYQLQDGVIGNLARKTRNNLAGVGTIGAIIEKTIGAPSVKTYGAVVIDKAAKKLQALGTGAGSKITKAMVLNAIREAQDEEKTTR